MSWYRRWGIIGVLALAQVGAIVCYQAFLSGHGSPRAGAQESIKPILPPVAPMPKVETAKAQDPLSLPSLPEPRKLPELSPVPRMPTEVMLPPVPPLPDSKGAATPTVVPVGALQKEEAPPK